MTRAVVFAYHDVGVRGLSVLLAHGVEVPLVVSHEDAAGETIFFNSVATLARLHGIPVITPESPNTAEVIERVRRAQPDFIFSFYYRHMLGTELLQLARHGAYNMHGSLLPRYRGRAPVNWAVLHGEAETGATLHKMVEKPDAGDIVAQEAVPILPNDTAHEVMQKVTWGAEKCLHNVLPDLLAGTATHRPLDIAGGSYFGRRRPEDGRIDWSQDAWAIHNLIRAVAPPYPGAFFEHGNLRLEILHSHFRQEVAQGKGPRLYWADGRCYADAADGLRFEVLRLQAEGKPLDEAQFRQRFGGILVPLT